MPQAPSVAIPKRLPLVIEPSNRDASVNFDARLVNCYMETKQSGEERMYWIYPRAGLELDSRPPAADAAGRGLFNWLGNVYSVFGDKLYKDGVAIAGTVDTTNGIYRFDSCLGATPKLQLGNGVKAYNYDAGTGLVQITDGDFPTAFCKGWAYLDGTTYVLVPTAHILGSDLNDPTAWNPLNDILAQIEPDQGVALKKQLVYVVVFKQWTTEIFYDAGNPTGSPLGRVEGAKVNWGCVHPDSVQELDSSLIWLGRTKSGSPEVILLDNLKASVVSTKAVERLIEDITVTTVLSLTLNCGGHRFYILTFKESNLTLVYDLDEKMWSQWTDENGNYVPWVSSCTNADLAQVVQHESNGKLYIASPAFADDDGELITVDIVTPNFDAGTRRRKQMNRLTVITDQRAGARLRIRVNDSDYNAKKWTNWRSFDLSQREPFLPDCGTFTRRVHQFQYKERVRMPRIQAMEMQLDIGTG